MSTKVASFVIALALGAAAPLSAQQDPRPEPPAMAVTARYLFVLRDGVVYQFDVDTLELKRQARLPAAASGPSADPRAAAPVRGRAVPAPDAEAVTQGLARALAWLRAHQDDDGKWDADDFMKHDADGVASDGPGNPVHDVGVTGLAVLAFLGSGSTLRAGPHADVLKKATRWLKEQQDDRGRIGGFASFDSIYDHAIATLALSEAAGLSEYKLLEQPAQKAIDYLEAHRNPYAVWRYQPRDNDNDLSVTTWCTMAYRSAQDFGLTVNPQALQLVATWLDQVTDPATGHAGYTRRGEPSSRHPGDHGRRFPPAANETLSAAGLFLRFLLGQQPAANEVMQRAADLVVAKPPRWSVEDGTIDEYGWYFGTLAMYQIGGDRWQQWRGALGAALLGAQRQDGAAAGSWDPVGVWGEDGGRVYSTALLALSLACLEREARVRGR